MRSLKLVAIEIFLFASITIHAQISVNLNIGNAPNQGPLGYTEDKYYRLSEFEAYYDVRATPFIYFGGGRWIRSRYLPNQYRNADLNGGFKVVPHDYQGSRPYNNFRSNKVKQYRGYHGREQRTIGFNDNRKYYDNDNRNYFQRDHNNDNREQYKKTIKGTVKKKDMTEITNNNLK